MHWVGAGYRIDSGPWSAIDHGFNSPATPSPLITAKQIHSTKIAKAEVGHQAEADGLWNMTIGISCGVVTADCLPVLFASPANSFVAAVHAGWRGLTAGILGELLHLYRRVGPLQDLSVAIGPAIGREKFEIGPEVRDAFNAKTMGLPPPFFNHVISKGKEDRWHADLQSSAALQLVTLGVRPESITIMRTCTYLDHDRWHSYRREGKGCKSNLSWIKL